MLEGLVKSKVNILISGGTGAGKTTLLNILSGYIPESERIVTIEDAAELQMQQPHVVRLETRPPNIEGKGEITQRALVRNALRMRPDRIVIGEVRGAEAVDMLQAMNTGHEGSLTTIHANTPRDALARLENMIGMANLNLPHKAARQQIASAITVVIQVLRLIDGRRKVTSIQEITGMEGEIITMQEIFAFKQTGLARTAWCRAISRPAACGRNSPTGCALSASSCPTRCSTRPRATNERGQHASPSANNSFPLLAVLVFVAVLLLLEGVYLMWKSYQGPEAKKIEQRLHALSATRDTSADRCSQDRMLSELPPVERLLKACRACTGSTASSCSRGWTGRCPSCCCIGCLWRRRLCRAFVRAACLPLLATGGVLGAALLPFAVCPVQAEAPAAALSGNCPRRST